jgi:retron-type reverse transcriptase
VGAFKLSKNILYCVSVAGSTQFQKCNPKTFRKNYKGDLVKKVWVFNNQSIKKRSWYIFTLRDRLLQMIIDIAVHPIVEYQSDPHSFAYRPNRSAIDAIALVVKHFECLQKQKVGLKYLQLKASKSICDNIKNKRVRKKWCVPALSPFIINIEIHKCFDNINHDIIVNTYPLCSKYRYFLKAWLKAPIYGLFFAESTNSIRWIPKKGIPKGSAIGPSIVNCVLDGIEKVLHETLQFDKLSKNLMVLKELKKFDEFRVYSFKNIKVFLRFLFLRVASNILILGQGPWVVFNFLFKVLVTKLKEKGLVLTDTDKPIFEFKSGTFFDYLGFRFFYESSTNKRKLKLSTFKNSFGIVRRNIFVINPSGFTLSIQPKFFQNCYVRIREILSKSNSRLSIDDLLRRYNFVIKGIVNYFGITTDTRNQLRYLDNLSYCWFRRLLLQKHSSAVRVHSLIHKFYYTKDLRVCWKQEKQLKTFDIKPLGNMPLISICLSANILRASLYLDLVELKKDQSKSLIWQDILKDYRISFRTLEKMYTQSDN